MKIVPVPGRFTQATALTGVMQMSGAICLLIERTISLKCTQENHYRLSPDVLYSAVSFAATNCNQQWWLFLATTNSSSRHGQWHNASIARVGSTQVTLYRYFWNHFRQKLITQIWRAIVRPVIVSVMNEAATSETPKAKIQATTNSAVLQFKVKWID